MSEEKKLIRVQLVFYVFDGVGVTRYTSKADKTDSIEELVKRLRDLLDGSKSMSFQLADGNYMVTQTADVRQIFVITPPN